MLAIILAGCSNKGEKYQKDIDKSVQRTESNE